MVFSKEEFSNYEGYIVTEIEEGFVHVQLNNPKSLNAFKEQTWRDYHEILTKLDREEDIKVILISSAVEKAFTSGLDLKDGLGFMTKAAGLDAKGRYEALHNHIKDFQYCIGTPARINTPTIGLLNGINYGLAIDMAACYSIRVAVEGARFSIREIKIGIPADIGSLQRMPAIVNNKSLLYQYALTGETFDAQAASRLGYVSKVLPNIKAGFEWCKELGEEINGHVGWAIEGTKASLQHIIDGGSVDEGLKNISHYNATNMDGRMLQGLGGPKL